MCYQPSAAQRQRRAACLRPTYYLLLLLSLTLIAPGYASFVQAQVGPTVFVEHAPPPLPPALQADGLLAALHGGALAASPQALLTCTETLADTTVSVAAASSPWREYRRNRLFSSEQAFSAPQALAFVEDNDGVAGDNGSDSDAAGQEIALPNALAELFGSLRYRYATGSTAAGDALRVELYEVGKLNPTGLIASFALDAASEDDGSWRRFEWELTDATALARLRALGQAALLVVTANVNNGATQRVWVDDIEASSCVAAATLSGRIGQRGNPNADVTSAPLVLVRSDAAGSTLVAITTPSADGAYSFGGVAALPSGASYQIWFVNSPVTPTRDNTRLGFYAGPRVAQLAEGAQVGGLDFDISDVALAGPASYTLAVASDTAPLRLSWTTRGVAGERYQLCLYDPLRANPASGLPAQLCGPILDPSRDPLQFDLAPASFEGALAPQFALDRAYRWYVVVYDRDPRADANYQYGFSFFERAVTLVDALPTTPEPAPIDAGEPALGVANADWTLLVYAAADNALGDPRRSSTTGRPATQLARLGALAAVHPGVNIVTLLDDYGPEGALLCAYLPNAQPDCRRRAEINSADPAVLGSFVAQSRTRYPARHTALLIVSPGQAAGGLALDESAPGAPDMDLSELRAAFAAAGLAASAKLDLLIYQAPLLGNLEVARASEPYARYMVGTPDQLWQIGPYDQLLPLLAGPMRDDLAAVALGTVDAYNTALNSFGVGRANLLVAYDLSRVPALWQRLNNFAAALRSALVGESAVSRAAIVAARAATRVYDSSGNGFHDRLLAVSGTVPAEEDALLDLRDLALRLRDASGIAPAVSETAGTLVVALDSPTETPLIALVRQNGRGLARAPLDFAGASGFAVLFPSSARLGDQATLSEVALYGPASPQRDSAWASFLRAYLAGTTGLGPGGVTAGATGAAQLRPQPGAFVQTDLALPMVQN